MKLNLSVICDYLPKSYQLKRFGPESRKLSLKRPLLYEAGVNMDKDRLYITRSDTLPKIPPHRGLSVVCVDQRAPQEWVNCGCEVLLITNSVSLISVFNEINHIYDKFDEWDDNLRDVLEADVDFDLKNMIKAGMTIFENPIYVVNKTMLVIFNSSIKTSPDGGEEISVSDDYFPLPVQESEMIKNVCRLERVITVPYVSSLEAYGNKSYCNNLYPFGYFAGCISISEIFRPFRESDYSLGDHFFVYFQKAFVKYLRSMQSQELPGTVALNNLFGNVPLSLEENELLSLAEGERWVCFQLREISAQKSLPTDYMYALLSALMSGLVYSTVFNDAIIGLIKIRPADSSLNRNTLKFFQEFLYKMEYIAGLSDEFTDIHQVKTYLQQANYAVGQGVESHAHSSGDNHLFHFGDYALQYMVSQCTGEFSAQYLYSNGLRRLIEHDRKSQTNYVETLDVFLKNEMNITATAGALFLHRSSLLKRLKRVQILLGSELRDPDIRLYLRLCLHMLRSDIQ